MNTDYVIHIRTKNAPTWSYLKEDNGWTQTGPTGRVRRLSGATIARLAATRSRPAGPQRPRGTEVGAAAQTTSAFSRSRENRLKCRSGLALLKSAPNDGHSHPRCGEDRHLACRFRALVGRQDARQPHSPGWLC